MTSISLSFPTITMNNKKNKNQISLDFNAILHEGKGKKQEKELLT